MKTQILSLVLGLFFSLVNAQTMQFISENSGTPLPQIFVYDQSGKLLAESDIEGKITSESLKPVQEKYSLIYENEKIGELTFSDLNREIVKLKDRVKTIEPVVLQDNSNAKYIFLEGNFNSTVTLNGITNCYADGIATHVFDNKNKKFLYTVVYQYRIYERTKPEKITKTIASHTMTGNLGILTPTMLTKDLSYYQKDSKNYTVRQVKTTNKDLIEMKATRFDDKVKKLLGIWITQAKGDYILAFEKDSEKKLRDFLEARLLISAKMKFRSEPDFNDLKVYQNFFPTNLRYGNDEIKTSVKFKTGNSYYSEKYWEKDNFPQLLQVISNFNGGKFVEVKNTY